MDAKKEINRDEIFRVARKLAQTTYAMNEWKKETGWKPGSQKWLEEFCTWFVPINVLTLTVLELTDGDEMSL